MKRFIMAASLGLCAFSANAFDWGPFNTPFWNRDPVNKLSHMAVAAPAAYYITRETGCPWIGQGALAAFGMFNELTDVNFSKPDLYSWMAGGAIGALAANYYNGIDKKKCGDTPYQEQRYDALSWGSKAFNAAILLGATPVGSISAAIVFTALRHEYTITDFKPNEDWPFQAVNSNLSSYNKPTLDTARQSDSAWMALD